MFRLDQTILHEELAHFRFCIQYLGTAQIIFSFLLFPIIDLYQATSPYHYSIIGCLQSFAQYFGLGFLLFTIQHLVKYFSRVNQ